MKQRAVDIEDLAKKRNIPFPPREPQPDLSTGDRAKLDALRQPRAIEAYYNQPLRRTAQYGVPVCDLQLRTFSIRNMVFFADFCMRAAYFLGLPAKGPVPLPRITERWTVPRSNFIFKKSQENFERVTQRRLIQIQDGHPETVQLWLAYIQKNQYYGVGMKANVFTFESLEVAKDMDKEAEKAMAVLDKAFENFGWRKGTRTPEEAMRQIKEVPFKTAPHGDAPMSKMLSEG
ncbi:ribosomal protein S10 [Saccharata proteae CBS 121410]|uniref:Small ribosomal subunit protein uS10m n=1 Tax=Saccharata proteae CBS 121410 TaxID=1314787 RepID=A0A9P4HXF1_9PEZI|nr:ribosomal protein S10 [Saccharata proteae CBS 121410]